MIGTRTLPLPPSAGARLPAGERIYAIGDIHGRLDLFERLIAAIRADDAARGPARTRLVLLGDLVDRGRFSAQTVDLCRAASERSRNFVVLRGNHEEVMSDALAGSDDAMRFWLRVGGRETLASWGIAEAVLEEGAPDAIRAAALERIGADTRAWLAALPLSEAAGGYLFVHAGIRPGVPLDEQEADDLLWIGDEFLGSRADHGAVVVHGHTVYPDGVAIAANRIGIDTGAWATGRLTALGLEGGERWVLATEAPAAADAAARHGAEVAG